MKQFIDIYNKRVPVYNRYVADNQYEWLADLSDDEIDDLKNALTEEEVQYFLNNNVMFMLDENLKLEYWVDLDSYIK